MIVLLVSVVGAVVLWPRRSGATPTSRSSSSSSSAPPSALDFLKPALSPLAFLTPAAPEPSAPRAADPGNELPGKPSIVKMDRSPLWPVGSQQAPVLNMKRTAGQSAKVPPSSIYVRFPVEINRLVADVNAAAAGLNVGLNSWWRPPDSVGEELSQHHLGMAIDFQGPDQDVLAGRLRSKGWTVLDRDNAGKPYNHRHAQLEKAGALARMGVTVADLRQWTA